RARAVRLLLLDVDVERLGLLAGGAVDQAPVGEHPVDIEEQEPDGAGSRGGPTGGHTILARRMSCMWITPWGWPAVSTMIRLVMAKASITSSACAARSSPRMSFGSRVMQSRARSPKTEA